MKKLTQKQYDEKLTLWAKKMLQWYQDNSVTIVAMADPIKKPPPFPPPPR